MPNLFSSPPVVGPIFPLLETQVADWSLSPAHTAGDFDRRIPDIALPPACQCIRVQETDIVWTGHDQWMVAGPLAATSPPKPLHGVQKSDARVIFTMPSDIGLGILSYGSAVDFDPAIFQPGFAAPTKIAHFAGLVWFPPTDDACINVAVFRSYAESFNHWLADRLLHLQSGKVT